MDTETSPDRNPLSRLYHTGSHRKSSNRTSPTDSRSTFQIKEDKKREKRGSKDSSGSKEKKDPTLLRKRIISTPAEMPLGGGLETSTLKPGHNILAQIGAPDHNGWMRKKGEHYNTWKNRYFVLKGPHLYWLKSNNQTVGDTLARWLAG